MTVTTVHPVDQNAHRPAQRAGLAAGAGDVGRRGGRAAHRRPCAQALARAGGAADLGGLFCCGLVTLIQSLGFGRHFGIRLPVMMGVTFAAVGPMVAMANVQGGPDGARAIFGAIIGAAVIAILMAPLMSRLLRFFPPLVTGSIITVIGISLMRVGIGWAMGGPAPAAQSVDMVKLVAMVDASKLAPAAGAASAAAAASAPLLKLAGPLPMLNNPDYGALDNLAIAAFVLLTILLLVRYGRGFLAHIAVLLGIVAGCALALGKMGFDKAGKAAWFDLVTPFAFGLPTFDPVMVPPRRLRRTEGRRGPARQNRYRACPSRQAGTRCQVAGANWVATPAKVR